MKVSYLFCLFLCVFFFFFVPTTGHGMVADESVGSGSGVIFSVA